MAHSAPRPAAPAPSDAKAFTPYVPASQSPAEFTVKAIVLGALFGLLFGASTVYLGLRAGLTVSASIPIAVLAISVLKRLGGSTILENNIVQTIGSAGESVAAGVVFTVPALLFLLPNGPGYFNYFQITLLAFAGGILGVLMMVPLRRALIVKEHGVLPYPEGTACADVLVAGERGGALASTVFVGLGVGAFWKALSWIFQIFRTAIGYTVARTGVFPNATLNIDISPEYMGVGYVIGPKIAGVMFAGGVLSWMVLLPLLTIAGTYMNVPFPPVPASGLMLSQMTPGQIWSAYIRYIGAGAVLAAGLITLARTIPTIVSSFRDSMKDIGAASGAAVRTRTERDMPMTVVLGGSLLLAIFLAVTPGHAHPGQLDGVDSRHRLRLLLRHGLLAHRRADRVLVEPDLGDDDRHAHPHLHDLRGARLDRRRLLADRALRRRARLHRRRQRRRHLAGSQDRVHRRRDADLPADWPRHRRARLGAHHRVHDALPERRDEDRVGGPAGAAGDPDVDHHQGPARPEPPVGPRALRGLRLGHAGALRHPFALLRGRVLPADRHDGSRSSWAGSSAGTSSARPGIVEESEVGSGTLFSSGLIAGGSLAGILYAVLFGNDVIKAADDAATLGVVPFLHEGPAGMVFGGLLFLALAIVVARVAQRKLQ